MRNKLKRAPALLCFLSLLLFASTASEDLSTGDILSRIPESQGTFLLKCHKRGSANAQDVQVVLDVGAELVVVVWCSVLSLLSTLLSVI